MTPCPTCHRAPGSMLNRYGEADALGEPTPLAGPFDKCEKCGRQACCECQSVDACCEMGAGEEGKT